MQIVRGIFSNDFTLTYTTAFQDTVKLLHPKLDLIICGSHFDTNRAHELLRYCKSDLFLNRIPFLGVRFLDDELPLPERDLTRSMLEHGGAAYIDFCRWKKQYGETEAHQKFYGLVGKLASDPLSIDLITLHHVPQ